MRTEIKKDEHYELIYSNGSEYELHENFVVVRLGEGIDHGLQEAIFVRQLMADNFTGPFGLISDRRNSYSIHPEYIEGVFEDFDNFKCVAWVNYASPLKAAASLHVSSYFPEFIVREYFDTLQEATAWVKVQLSNTHSGKSE